MFIYITWISTIYEVK